MDRQSLLGERLEIRQKHQRQGVQCEALRQGLQKLLGSPAATAEDLDRDAILDTAAVLHTELGELQILARKLAVLNQSLGD